LRRLEVIDHTDFDSWQDVLDTLEQGGMTDHKKYPEVYMAWRIAGETDDFTLLEELLSRDPWVLTKAVKRIKEFPFFQPKREELHEIEGELNLGTVIPYPDNVKVGFSYLDLTRSLFICGETGSGKSYPVLRICDYILSVPKKLL
jgi:hypothetical protein